jgi:hypothetical protein
MCHEKTKPGSPQDTLTIYLTAVLSIPTLEAEIARTAPPNPAPAPAAGPVRLPYTSFTRYRELWRWVERLLWRAVVLAARAYALGAPDEPVLWALLAQYQACAAHWPPTFRPAHRTAVAGLHLRALVLRARMPAVLPNPASAAAIPDGKAAWVATARRVVRDARDVLSATTRFPRANERNARVEELVDLTMAVWDASVQILWWATRLTFNSPRVFRHMTRVAEAAGDAPLAARTLRLYTQVVSKARAARETDADDSDAHWVKTLVAGSRMLCRAALCADAAEGKRGIDEAREAGTMLVRARERLHAADHEMLAQVELAEGVWETVMALKGAHAVSCPAHR